MDVLNKLLESDIENVDLSILTDDFFENIILNSKYSEELCTKLISLPGLLASRNDVLPTGLLYETYFNRLISISCNIDGNNENSGKLNEFRLNLLLRLVKTGFLKGITKFLVSCCLKDNNAVPIIFRLCSGISEFHFKKFVKFTLQEISHFYKVDKNLFYMNKQTTELLEQFKAFEFVTIFHPLNDLPLIPSIHFLDLIIYKDEAWKYLLNLWSDELLSSMLPSSGQILIGCYLTRLISFHKTRVEEGDFDSISSGIRWRLSSYNKSARLSAISVILSINQLGDEKDEDLSFEEFECIEASPFKASMKNFQEVNGDLEAVLDEMEPALESGNAVGEIISKEVQIPTRSHLTKPYYLRQILERIQGNLVRGDVDFELVKSLAGGSPLDKIEDSNQKIQRIVQALFYLPIILDRNPPDAELETLSLPIFEALISLTMTYDVSQMVQFGNVVSSMQDMISRSLTKLILTSFKPIIKCIPNSVFNMCLPVQSKIVIIESAIDAVLSEKRNKAVNIHPDVAIYGIQRLIDGITDFIQKKGQESYCDLISCAPSIINVDVEFLIIIARLIDLIVMLKMSTGSGWSLLGRQAYETIARMKELHKLLLTHLPPNRKLVESLTISQSVF